MLKLLKALAVAAMMLVPVSAKAACVEDSFVPADTTICAYGTPVRSVTQNGITISYSCYWQIDKDADAPGIQCAPLSPYIPWNGDVANEPSPTYYLRKTFPACSNSFIFFDPPVQSVTFRYAASGLSYAWDCTDQLGCAPSTCTCLQNPMLPIRVTWYYNEQPMGQTYLTEEGTGGSGDPNGWLNTWGTGYLYRAQGISSISFCPHTPSGGGCGGNSPFYIDDLVACNEDCPDPPCGFERATAPRAESKEQPPLRTSWGRIKTIYR